MLAGAMAHRRLLWCNGLSTPSSGVGELWMFMRFVVFWRLFIHYAWLLHLVGYCYAEASVFSSYSSSRDYASPTLRVSASNCCPKRHQPKQSPSTSVGAKVVRSGGEGPFCCPRPVPPGPPGGGANKPPPTRRP